MAKKLGLSTFLKLMLDINTSFSDNYCRFGTYAEHLSSAIEVDVYSFTALCIF